MTRTLDVEERAFEEQIICLLRESEPGMPIKDLHCQHGFSEASLYLWRSKFGGLSVPDAKRLTYLEAEDTRLEKLLAEQVFEHDVFKDALRRTWQPRRRTGCWCGAWLRSGGASGER